MGRFIRSIHKWSAYLLVIFIFLHTVRVVIYRAYQKPANSIGSAAFFLMLLVAASALRLSLTMGSKAYWATRVGTTLVEKIPLSDRGSAYFYAVAWM